MQLGRALPLSIPLIERAQRLLGCPKLLLGGRHATLDEPTLFARCTLARMHVEIGETVKQKLEDVTCRDRVGCLKGNADDACSLVDANRDPISERLDAFIKATLRGFTSYAV